MCLDHFLLLCLDPKTEPRAKVYNGAVHQASDGTELWTVSDGDGRPLPSGCTLFFPFHGPNIGTNYIHLPV